MKELKEDIIEAVQDATDTVDGTVSIPILDHFLDGILTNQLRLHSVSNFIRQELERRVDLILSEPDGIVRETMIKNIPLDL